MSTVLVTGAQGFIGKNLVCHLSRQDGIEVISYDLGSEESVLERGIVSADYIFHLAGVNRPQDPSEFESGNHGFTEELLAMIRRSGRRPVVVATSSSQAILDNPYGVSKRKAELELEAFKRETGCDVYVYRLTNVFGKWSRPNYNSVVATFCYQAAHGIPLKVDDPSRVIEFIYIDDIVKSFLSILDGEAPDSAGGFRFVRPTYSVLLGDLAKKIEVMAGIRSSCIIPDFADLFDKYLYSTYLSFLESDDFAYPALKKEDGRGYLFELIKSTHAGQVFVSRTLPGIVRGNHYHHTKIEKFCVVDGTARIAFRHVISGERVEYIVEGKECRIVDIPPGWTHNITNIGSGDLITIFWANELFSPETPDTYSSEV